MPREPIFIICHGHTQTNTDELLSSLRLDKHFFYSSDRNEPIHVHVEADENIAKVPFDPIRSDHKLSVSILLFAE